MASSINGATTPPCSIASIPNGNGRFGSASSGYRDFQDHYHYQPNRIVAGPGTALKASGNRGAVCNGFYGANRRPRSELGSDFCGKRSTRVVSKMHFGRPKTSNRKCNHSLVAEAVLAEILSAEQGSVEGILDSRVFGPEDYGFLLRELGNRGECSKVLRCFNWSVRHEKRKNEQAKLVSIVISILGRLGRVDLAQEVFDRARSEGYGNNVYAFSALVSAYGRSAMCREAISVFELMKNCGCKPNLVTYNALIDACGKGGVDFKTSLKLFEEMISEGVQPDRITFNSLIAVCSRGGLWEEAQEMFQEMLQRGIEQDIFTYNTLLDAVCKGGQMDLAASILSGMSEKNIVPNVITYSTMIDGYAKAGRLNEAQELYHEMKSAGLDLDRVSYNTLLSAYAKLGRFDEALRICSEMEEAGFKKDAVTYNALLGGYGKQGKYDQVKTLFKEMKRESVTPNVLTYSTLIDVYSKGGLQSEAMKILNEFKRTGLKPDVVLYSAYIDALCKNGAVEEAVHLLDDMTKEGITPNVVTYNSIIDALGVTHKGESNLWSLPVENFTENAALNKALHPEPSKSTTCNMKGKMKFEFGQMVKMSNCKSLNVPKVLQPCSNVILSTVEIFHRMKKLGIKPNVVTFSVILKACSRCQSFEEASLLLEELRLFDSRVYGVAHGLLMGFRERVWGQAQALFDEVTRMDSATASAFYNALTDMLWHFGQRKGAQLVVLDGRRRQVWENAWCDSCLDLHLMSAGAAQAMVHAWLLSIRAILFEGRELPRLLSILTGWGKHSKVAGDSTLRRCIETLLSRIGAPFHLARFNEGRFTSTGPVVAAWLRESGTLELLILHDEIVDSRELISLHN
eukprot:TRINITY_DN2458_c0_g1_i1.p1 TRINITY_DN2458_c0_g1~~TRINITY_DN2458_c0_g1_i1.p1  ORF type:complete len:853 (+),score=132.61 TRINITY_DN2458_c0_g1_i1:553-3111(+)